MCETHAPVPQQEEQKAEILCVGQAGVMKVRDEAEQNRKLPKPLMS